MLLFLCVVVAAVAVVVVGDWGGESSQKLSESGTGTRECVCVCVCVSARGLCEEIVFLTLGCFGKTVLFSVFLFSSPRYAWGVLGVCLGVLGVCFGVLTKKARFFLCASCGLHLFLLRFTRYVLQYLFFALRAVLNVFFALRVVCFSVEKTIIFLSASRSIKHFLGASWYVFSVLQCLCSVLNVLF